jgi:hypothetical protein
VGAIDRGATPDGQAYVAGGIGAEEIEQLTGERGRFSLWVITAAKRSGAYLADVDLRITSGGGKVVFQRVLAGLWLLVDLPPGKYLVQASYGGETRTTPVSIDMGGHRQSVLYFDVPADALTPQERAAATR